ncbi:MAG: carotenoid oxygenase family protein [Proteobacteria bacterium]|nr:carotenoid oxygenase family protein [Pseudomonadota bacterium]
MTGERGGPASKDRRRFLASAAAGAAVTVGAAAAPAVAAGVDFPKARGKFGAGGSESGGVSRAEMTLHDCEVEGQLPLDLDGTFYRVGPDAQYPKPKAYEDDIFFDGEGHVSMFRFRNGHVDFTSRYVRNDRWKAQHEARRSLFGYYRNRASDDPSVQNVRRGSHNTHVWVHANRLYALKEDSPPALIHPHTLETLDANYTFGGALTSQTFTAHPKNDPETGEMFAFGYEAAGLGSTDINVFSVGRDGQLKWSAWINAPYCCMLHDFAVTRRHIAFLAIPMAYSPASPVHWAWDSTKQPWLGVMRRGGDGKDIRWVPGPMNMSDHTMGSWSDGDRFYWDMDGADGNRFPFFPHLHDSFDPVKGQARVRRFSMDLSKKRITNFDMQVLYPDVTGALSRQDDRYNVDPYRYGFLVSNTPGKGAGWTMFDHQARSHRTYNPGPDISLNEAVFAPRRKGAPEADGYLMGMAYFQKENRSEVLVLDTRDITAGPIARVQLPFKATPQIHGNWIPADQLPAV